MTEKHSKHFILIQDERLLDAEIIKKAWLDLMPGDSLYISISDEFAKKSGHHDICDFFDTIHQLYDIREVKVEADMKSALITKHDSDRLAKIHKVKAELEADGLL